MRLSALVKLVTASCAFSAVVLTSMMGRAQDPTPTANWVNIKSPAFGAYGDGVHDDTAAIQAAIDYAFNNNLSAVYCPAGTYKTSNTIWLDPPTNMREVTWTGTGYVAGGVFTLISTSTGTFNGQYSYLQGSGVPVGTMIVSGSGPYTLSNSFTLGSSGSPVNFSAISPNYPSKYTFTMAFFGDPSAGRNYFGQGCNIYADFATAPIFMVGTGYGMHVSNILLYCTVCAYRGNNVTGSVALGLSGGSGGSSNNLVEKVWVGGTYSGFRTDANYACCLDDSVTFRNVTAMYNYAGIDLYGQQSAIITIEKPVLGNNTISLWNHANENSVTVNGGNLSNESGVSSSFGLSNVSTLSAVSNSGFPYLSNGNGISWDLFTFTATVASPDQYVPNVYNSWVLNTAHFGVVPVVLCPPLYCASNWNASTNQATFMLWPPWVFANYGYIDLTNTSNTDIQAELQAAPTIYAAERVTVLLGGTIKATGISVEETNACYTLADTSAPLISGSAPSASAGGNSISIENSDTSDPGNNGAVTPVNLCQQSFPYVYQPLGGHILLDNDTLYAQELSLAGPIIDLAGPAVSRGLIDQNYFVARNLRRLAPPNVRYSSGSRPNATNFGPINITNDYLDQYSSAHGGGYWDKTPFLPRASSTYIAQTTYATEGEMGVPFVGYRPAPWATPSMPPGLYSLVSGTLGALGTYPVINCETVYKSIEWNSATLTHLWLRSASCPMFSYGQNLTNATTGGTVTWSYKGQTNVLYLDATTLSWMFSGLAVSINNGSGPHTYVVTGVYPSLGYITVVDGTTDQNHNSTILLAGDKSTVYSCSSSCTIGQAPFAWTAY